MKTNVYDGKSDAGSRLGEAVHWLKEIVPQILIISPGNFFG